MARSLRLEFAGALYHVTSRGNERKPIYRDDADRHRFLVILADVVDRFHLLLHAYVLMDNHYHLLVETLEANLARAMRQLNGDHAKRFNRAHRRVGHLFGRRYHAIVDRDSYLVELRRYVHLNPVRAGMVERADHYRWSSAQAYTGRATGPAFLTTAELLGRFGSGLRHAQSRYSAFLRNGEQRPPRSPLEDVVAGTLLGHVDWVHAMRARIDACIAAGRTAPGGGEIPAVRRLRIRPTLAALIDTVATAMKVGREAITDRHSRSCARAVDMHLSCRVSGLKQVEIGVAFGVGRFAVSKAAAIIERRAREDGRLRSLINHLREELDARQ